MAHGNYPQGIVSALGVSLGEAVGEREEKRVPERKGGACPKTGEEEAS